MHFDRHSGFGASRILPSLNRCSHTLAEAGG
jgi:hypothetical protein